MNVSNIIKDLPSIETARLLLRKLRIEDAPDMFEYGQDPEIARRGLWSPLLSMEDSRKDIEDALAGYAAGNLLSWAIEHTGDGKMIGRISLMPYSLYNARAEIGYAMNRRYWGGGLMTEAVAGLLEFGFSVLGLNRVQAIVLPDNAGSRRVLEKNGLEKEGYLKSYQYVDGQYIDVELYALVKSAWAARQIPQVRA